MSDDTTAGTASDDADDELDEGGADPDAPVDFTPGELTGPIDPDDDGHEVST